MPVNTSSSELSETHASSCDLGKNDNDIVYKYFLIGIRDGGKNFFRENVILGGDIIRAIPGCVGFSIDENVAARMRARGDSLSNIVQSIGDILLTTAYPLYQYTELKFGRELCLRALIRTSGRIDGLKIVGKQFADLPPEYKAYFLGNIGTNLILSYGVTRGASIFLNQLRYNSFRQPSWLFTNLYRRDRAVLQRPYLKGLNLLNARDLQSIESSHKLLYIIDSKGRLKIASNLDSRLSMYKFVHHSDLSRGKPVLAAGEIIIDQGVIKEINLFSGHYTPKNTFLIQKVICHAFKRAGFPDISKVYHPSQELLKQALLYDSTNVIKPGISWQQNAIAAALTIESSVSAFLFSENNQQGNCVTKEILLFDAESNPQSTLDSEADIFNESITPDHADSRISHARGAGLAATFYFKRKRIVMPVNTSNHEPFFEIGSSRCELFCHKGIHYYAENNTIKEIMKQVIDNMEQSTSNYKTFLWSATKERIKENKVILMGIAEDYAASRGSVLKLLNGEHVILLRTTDSPKILSGILLHEISHFHPLGQLTIPHNFTTEGLLQIDKALLAYYPADIQEQIERLINALNKSAQSEVYIKFSANKAVTPAQKEVCEYLFKYPLRHEQYLKNNKVIAEFFTHGAQVRDMHPEVFKHIAPELDQFYESIAIELKQKLWENSAQPISGPSNTTGPDNLHLFRRMPQFTVVKSGPAVPKFTHGLIYNSAVGITECTGNEAALKAFLAKLLPEQINSFLGGTVHIQELAEDLIVYRTGENGRYWSTTLPKSPWQHSLETAMHPELYPTGMKQVPDWHPANSGVLKYRIPKGTIIAYGTVDPQYGFPGMGKQVFMPTPPAKIQSYSWSEFFKLVPETSISNIHLPQWQTASKVNEIILQRGIPTHVFEGKTLPRHVQNVAISYEGNGIRVREWRTNFGKSIPKSGKWRISPHAKMQVGAWGIEAVILFANLYFEREANPLDPWRESLVNTGMRHIPTMLINMSILPLWGFPPAFVSSLLITHMMDNVIDNPEICYKAAVLLCNDREFKGILSDIGKEPWNLNSKTINKINKDMMERYHAIMSECIPDYGKPKFEFIRDPKQVQAVVNAVANDREYKQIVEQLPLTFKDLKNLSPEKQQQLAEQLITRANHITRETCAANKTLPVKNSNEIDYTALSAQPLSPFFQHLKNITPMPCRETALHFSSANQYVFSTDSAAANSPKASENPSIGYESPMNEMLEMLGPELTNQILAMDPFDKNLVQGLFKISNQLDSLCNGKQIQVPLVQSSNKDLSKKTAQPVAPRSIPFFKMPHWSDKVHFGSVQNKNIGPVKDGRFKINMPPLADVAIKVDTSVKGSVFFGAAKAGGGGFAAVGGLTIELGADWLASLMAAIPGALAVGAAAAIVYAGVKLYQYRKQQKLIDLENTRKKHALQSSQDVITGNTIYEELFTAAITARTNSDITEVRKKQGDLTVHCDKYIKKAKERRRNNGMSNSVTNEVKQLLSDLKSNGIEIENYCTILESCLTASPDEIVKKLDSQGSGTVKELLIHFYHDRQIKEMQTCIENKSFDQIKKIVSHSNYKLDTEVSSLFLGVAEQGLQNYKEAAGHFDTYLKSNPEDTQVARAFIDCLFETEDYQQLIDFSNVQLTRYKKAAQSPLEQSEKQKEMARDTNVRNENNVLIVAGSASKNIHNTQAEQQKTSQKEEKQEFNQEDIMFYEIIADEANVLKELKSISEDKTLTMEKAIEKRGAIPTKYFQFLINKENAQAYLQLKEFDKAETLLLEIRDVANRDTFIESLLVKSLLGQEKYDEAVNNIDNLLNDKSLFPEKFPEGTHSDVIQQTSLFKQQLLKDKDFAQLLHSIKRIKDDTALENKPREKADKIQGLISEFHSDTIRIEAARCYLEGDDYASAQQQLSMVTGQDTTIFLDILYYQVAMGLKDYQEAMTYAQKILDDPKLKELAKDLDTEAIKLLDNAAEWHESADFAKFNDRVQAYTRVMAVSIDILINHFDPKREMNLTRAVLHMQRICPTLIPVMIHSFQRMSAGERNFFMTGLGKSLLPFRKGYDNTKLDRVFAGINLCVAVLHLVPSESFQRDLIKLNQALYLANEIKTIGQGMHKAMQLANDGKLLSKDLKLSVAQAMAQLTSIGIEKFLESQGGAIQHVSYYVIRDLLFTTAATYAFYPAGVFYIKHASDFITGNYHDQIYRNTLYNISKAMEKNDINRALRKGAYLADMEDAVKKEDSETLKQLKITYYNLELCKLIQVSEGEFIAACKKVIENTEIDLEKKVLLKKNISIDLSFMALQFRLTALLSVGNVEQFHKEYVVIFQHLMKVYSGDQRSLVQRALFALAANSQQYSGLLTNSYEIETIACLQEHLHGEKLPASVITMIADEQKLFLAQLFYKCESFQKVEETIQLLEKDKRKKEHWELLAQSYVADNKIGYAQKCLSNVPINELSVPMLQFMANFYRYQRNNYWLALEYILAIPQDKRNANDWKFIIDLITKFSKHYLGQTEDIQVIDFLKLLCVEKILESKLLDRIEKSNYLAIKEGLSSRYAGAENTSTEFTKLYYHFSEGRLGYLLESLLKTDEYSWELPRFQFNSHLLCNSNKTSILLLAKQNRDNALLNRLLQLPINITDLLNIPDANEDNLLMQGIKENNTALLNSILPYINASSLTHFNKQGNTALNLAFKLGKEALVLQLIQHPAFDEAMLFLRNSQGNSVGHDLIHQKSLVNIAKYIPLNSLLSLQNSRGDNFLILAIKSGQITAMQTLLEYADEKTLSQSSTSGETLLMWACFLNLPNVVQGILNSNRCSSALLEQVDNQGDNALLIALKQRNLKCFEYLLQSAHCSDKAINHIDKYGDNSLTIALREGLVIQAQKIIKRSPASSQCEIAKGVSVQLWMDSDDWTYKYTM